MPADGDRSHWMQHPGRVLAAVAGRALAVSLLALASACAAGGDAGASADVVSPIAALGSVTPGGRIHVVASTSVVGDVVANVAGPDVDVLVLVPPGTDPHGFTLAPRDLQAVGQSQAVLISGFGLEQAILPDLAAASNAPIVSISEGIEPLVFGFGGQEARAQTSQPVDAQADPHVWMDPTNVQRWARNAAEVLSRLDPENKGAYQQRASSYIDRLTALDRWIQEQVRALPSASRLLVTDHYALGYFANRYQFVILGAIVPAASSMAEPVPQDLAELERKMMAQGAPAIFVESGPHPAAVDSVANDTGANVVGVYIGSLSPASGPAPTYLQMMKLDTERILEALTP